MSGKFQKHEIEFRYPENWELIDQTDSDPDATVTLDVLVESPSGAFWALHRFPPGVDLDSALESGKAALADQYDNIEFHPFCDWNETEHRGRGCEAQFYCLDFLVTAGLWAIATPEATYVLCSQAENREYDQLRDVFRAITLSLLQRTTVS